MSQYFLIFLDNNVARKPKKLNIIDSTQNFID